MSYQGHCICGRIRVLLQEQPPSSLVCHCRNCSRSGGGSSINYILPMGEVTIQDPHTSLKVYEDANTDSGNHIQRKFCSNCGSPIATETPSFPGMVIVKASLFDVISLPNQEVFTARRQAWKTPIEGAKQA
ncbi:Mss4-like protein [Aspergillus bertholletiae]|uniref:Mss4-like protein n=1 Tax=Aspergillus bertholletiae TaxID=1226010 RepID=A0A5N7BDE1_9EURO|nr:Mss4-like protein [Aspergillus bertholletiae]